MNNSYILAIRADHDNKEVAITARDPERSGCQVINSNGRRKLHWNWLNAKNRSDLNNWEIIFADLSRAEARLRKEKFIQLYLELGYTIRTVKNYEYQ